MTPINLIPNDRLRSARRRERLGWWGRVLAGYALLLVAFGAGAGALTDQSARLEKLDAQIAQTQVKAETAERSLAAGAPLLQELQHSLETSRRVTTQPNWGVLLALLAESKGAQVVFERCLLEPVGTVGAVSALIGQSNNADKASGGYRLSVDGYGRSQREVSEFILALEQAGLFDRIHVKQTQRAQLMGRDVTSFQMEGLLSGQGESP
jgi:hypothetical protein